MYKFFPQLDLNGFIVKSLTWINVAAIVEKDLITRITQLLTLSSR